MIFLSEKEHQICYIQQVELLNYAENGQIYKLKIIQFQKQLFYLKNLQRTSIGTLMQLSYIQIILIINSSGDFVTEDIWFRIIQIIVGFQKEGNQELQKYAATKLFSQLSMPHVHKTLICIGAFIISEYSQMLVEQNKEPQKLFDIFNKHYTFSTERSRQMLLNDFVKLARKYPELRDQAIMICQIDGEHFDPDIQQRGIEYFSLLMEDDKLLIKQLLKYLPIQNKFNKIIPLQREFMEWILHFQIRPEFKQVRKQQWLNKDYKTSLNNYKSISDQSLLKVLILWCLHLQENNLKSQTISNLNQIKVLLTAQVGKVVDKPGELVVQYKSEISGHLGKVSFQFEGTSPISNLSILDSQTNGMLYNILPIKQGDFPQVMMQVLSYDGNMTLPISSIFYEQNGQQKKHEFHLPIYTNKFVQPVDMQHDKFTKFFDDFANNLSNQNYFKLDTFIRNTTPSNILMTEVLRKTGGLLSVGLNLKAQPFPSLESLQMIWACGQLIIKPPEQNNILNLPIKVVISSLDQSTEFLRMGIRCGGNGEIAKNYLKLIMLYLG
ncbi:unnamed protein product (macronuclear) [Paramecium tetraurelia]|uniref:Uncharacterized protein n=1 Tax=Paramecium tetraurelia TaxID=5888 RepID=A0DEM5_PARTE|nr:uncharacterized protein GSPATT00016318001 [Paramecium tetraurelia]CAK81492.1 unnamed protein product [Paramecium tetraurelia]|eukprot:XP_001448889.1 hypothetical protein (macronuclear) [Paramecium tetraurelia strain d4-2]